MTAGDGISVGPDQVIHVSGYYPPHLGGTEEVVRRLFEHRLRRSLPVRVVTSDIGWHPSRHERPLVGVSRLRAVETAHTPLIPGLPASLWASPRPALFHAHISQAFVPEVAALVARVRGEPFIAHMHLDAPPSGPAGGLLRWYKPVVLGRVLRSAARVIVFSDHQVSDLARSYGVDPQRVAVVPNGVDIDAFAAVDRTLHRPRRLLFVGRLGPTKNIPYLFEALTSVSDQFETNLVGDGEMYAELQDLVTRSGLRNVRFHGRLDGEALRQQYTRADLFVLPSLREGMPLALLEAMASGLPVVATDVVGLRDVIHHDRTGLLVPLDDPASFRSSLFAATEPVRWSRLSEAASASVQAQSWESVGERVEALYREVWQEQAAT